MSAIGVKRLPHGEGMPLPPRATALSAGFDLAAAIESDITIAPNQRTIVPTGLTLEIPAGYEVQVRSRSGLAAKHGVFVLNSPGTIDADYRGEVKVILFNSGDCPFVIKRGDRIAQAVPATVAIDIIFKESSELTQTERGIGGFGSSGI